MDENQERAFQYRQRAEELRAIIPDMKDPVCRETLVKVAADYDRLAEVQERIAENKRDADRGI
jgi:hypothetical protein